jgi:hypothetical protein
MESRGQMAIGGLVLLAVTLIVGVVLLQGSAQNLGPVTNTVSVANTSLATVVNGTAQYLTAYKSLTNVVVYNETGDVLITAGNYTVTNNVVYNGQLAVKIVPETSADLKSAWLVSGTAQLPGYASDSGSRSMAGIIIILMAVALAVFAVGYAVKQYYE